MLNHWFSVFVLYLKADRVKALSGTHASPSDSQPAVRHFLKGFATWLLCRWIKKTWNFAGGARQACRFMRFLERNAWREGRSKEIKCSLGIASFWFVYHQQHQMINLWGFSQGFRLQYCLCFCSTAKIISNDGLLQLPSHLLLHVPCIT